MRFYEAIKALEEGKKVRNYYWGKGEYIYKGEDGRYYSANGIYCGTISGINEESWEIYDDRKDVDKSLKELYKILKEVCYGDFNEYDEYLGDEDIPAKNRCDYADRLYNQLLEMNRYYKLDK